MRCCLQLCQMWEAIREPARARRAIRGSNNSGMRDEGEYKHCTRKRRAPRAMFGTLHNGELRFTVALSAVLHFDAPIPPPTLIPPPPTERGCNSSPSRLGSMFWFSRTRRHTRRSLTRWGSEMVSDWSTSRRLARTLRHTFTYLSMEKLFGWDVATVTRQLTPATRFSNTHGVKRASGVRCWFVRCQFDDICVPSLAGGIFNLLSSPVSQLYSFALHHGNSKAFN